MERQLRISIAQMDVQYCEPERNYARVEQIIREAAPNSDVIVLPELWNTGFFPKEGLERLSDRNGEKTRQLLGGLARELSVHIVGGSVANLIDGAVYNSAYIFDRSGNELGRYDKTHLFSPMGEHESFAAGDHVTVFELDGVRCGILICYDIRFPEWVRTIALKGIDVLFVVSQWPAARIEHVDILTRARAIENQCFLVYANTWAQAGETVYGGHSALIDPLGTVIARADDRACTISGTIDLNSIQSVRESINVYRDRRPALYCVGCL